VSLITSHELFTTAKLSLDLGYRDVGMALLEHLLQQVPGHVAAHCLLGATLAEREQWVEAQEQFACAVAVDPLNQDAVRGMARVDMAMGAAPEESQYVRWGLAFYPQDDTIRQLGASSLDECSPLALARALTVAGRHEEAVPYYEAACDQASEDGEYRSAVELLLAEALWNIGRIGNAWPLAEELASERPMWVRPKLILADILLEQRDDARGVALLHEAAGLDPSLVAAQEMLGQHDRYDSFLSQTLEVQGPPDGVISEAPVVLRYLLRAEPLPPPVAAQARQEGPSPAVSQVPQSLQKAKGESVTGERVAEVCEIALPAEMGAEQDQDLEDGCPEVASVRLILSSRNRLTALFGGDGYRELDGRLSALCEAAARSTGAEAIKIYVDDDSCLAEFGLHGVDPSDPERVADLIREIESRLVLESRQVLSLLIVGGDAIIPFHRMANPADDEDPEVLTDWPYAARADNALLSRFSVGRLPDPGDGELDTLMALVDRAIAHHESSSSQANVSASVWRSPIRRFFSALRSGHASVGYSAEIWAEASRSVFEVIGDPRKLQLSPPSTDYDFLSAYEQVPTLAYFNLHGFSGSPYWYGHGEAEHGSPLLPIALTPLAVSWASAEGAVVFSEACYGAEPPGRHEEGSIALSFLSLGALAFIGSTGMSYGTLAPPLSGADLLGRYLWEGIVDGLSVGGALRRARAEFVQAVASEQGYLDGEDQKALMSFVLYGDPSLSLHAKPAFPDADVELDVACPPLACCSRMMDAESLPLPKDVRAKVQRSLPFLQTNGLMGHPLVLCRVDCSGSECGTQSCGCDSGEARGLPGLIQASQQSIVSKGGHQLRHVVKVTVNADGDVVKVMVSRGGTQMPEGSDRR
jgi:tetratricopeptide (TPR) repeat protein